jgi:ribonuclease HI
MTHDDATKLRTLVRALADALDLAMLVRVDRLPAEDARKEFDRLDKVLNEAMEWAKKA